MATEQISQNWFLRAVFALLAFAIPVLVGLVIYDQIRSPVVDLILDWDTGVLQAVFADSLADWSGFHVGDQIIQVDGIPFEDWQTFEVRNYLVEVNRGNQTHTLELPVLSIFKHNPWALISAVLIALTYWGLSLILLARRFQYREIRLLFLTVQTLAITLLLQIAYSSFYPQQWAMDLSVICLYLSAPLGFHYYLTFPVYLGAAQQRKIALVLVYLGALLSIAAWLVRIDNAVRLGVIHTIVVYTAAMGLVCYSYFFKAVPDERRRLRILLLGTILAGVPAILFYLVPTFLGFPHRMPLWLVGLFTVIAPIAYYYAILRHNLFEIDRLLNRTLVYAILSLGILILYLGPFLLIYRLTSGDILAQTMVAAGLTLIVGLAFGRTRLFVQRLVDRLFYGGWYDFPSVIETISDALSRSTQRSQVEDVLIVQVSDLMQLHPGQLWIGGPDQTLPHKKIGRQIQFAFDLQNQYQGIWTISPRRDGDDFSDSDRRILSTLAHQAEIALNNVLLIETLQKQLSEIRKTQRQLLRSREEERSRLARELHDGPIQTLVGLNLQLGLNLVEQTGETRNSKAETSSPFSQSLLEMRKDVKALLGELRTVCAELRPPMLDAIGLGAAIRALSEDWTQENGIAVQLELPGDDRFRSLPEEVRVNLYRVIQEALTNAARHASPGQVYISLVREEAFWQLLIKDDGCGFVPPFSPDELTAKGHFGLAGIQERVDLIGGKLELKSAPDEGTEVLVTIDDVSA
jgi:signal transduction histidine kinase